MRRALTALAAAVVLCKRTTRQLTATRVGVLALALLLGSGCATLPDQARLKRQAESIVWGAMGGTTPALRVRATRLAAELGDPLLARGLPARLSDTTAAVRVTAAVALARTSPGADVLRAALDGSDPQARALAIDGLGLLSDGRSRLPRLAGDPDADVRARTASALGLLHPPGARLLLSSLAHDGDAGVRAQAIVAFGALGDSAALADVVAALSDPSLGVRLAALGALVRLGRAELDARLRALVAAPDRYLALRAAVQLARGRGDPAAAAAVVQAAASAADPALRVAALNAAGELGPPGRRVALSALGDGVLDVRLAAARALLTSGDDDRDRAKAAARATLRAALDDPQAGPRALDAAEELARLGDPTGLDRLRAVAHSPDASVRRDALARLAPLPAGRDPLIAALADSDGDIRLDAAAALLRRILR